MGLEQQQLSWTPLIAHMDLCGHYIGRIMWPIHGTSEQQHMDLWGHCIGCIIWAIHETSEQQHMDLRGHNIGYTIGLSMERNIR